MPKIVWALWVFNPFLSLSLYYFVLSFCYFMLSLTKQNGKRSLADAMSYTPSVP